MAGFAKGDVAAELARREHAQRDLEIGRSNQDQRNRIANADTECPHCHTPSNSVTGRADGLCDLCFYVD